MAVGVTWICLATTGCFPAGSTSRTMDPSAARTIWTTTSTPLPRDPGTLKPTTIHARPVATGATGGLPVGAPTGTRVTASEDLRAQGDELREVERPRHAVAVRAVEPGAHHLHPGLGPRDDEQVGEPVAEGRGREERRALNVGMESAQERLSPATGGVVARIEEPQVVAPEGGDREERDQSRLRTTGVRPDEGRDGHGAPESGRDDGAPARARGHRQGEEDCEALHGPLPMRFTSATSLGLSGSSSRMFTQFCMKLAT